MADKMQPYIYLQSYLTNNTQILHGQICVEQIVLTIKVIDGKLCETLYLGMWDLLYWP